MRLFSFRQQHGAILLEVLAAVVILAVGLTGIMQAIMMHLRASVVAQEYFLAAQVLDDAMTGPLLTMFPQANEQSSSCFIEGNQYQCALNITDTRSSGDPQIVFDRADIQLTWPSNHGKRAMDAAIYLARSAAQ